MKRTVEQLKESANKAKAAFESTKDKGKLAEQRAAKKRYKRASRKAASVRATQELHAKLRTKQAGGGDDS